MSHLQRLRCPACSFVAVCGAGEMLRWLQTAGMMRRAKDSERALIEELFAKTAGRFRCPSCGRTGLTVEALDDEAGDEAWGMARTCTACGRPIGAERLEILPQATLCAACQQAAEAGAPSQAETPEYCPRCGAVMTLRPTRSAGVLRYVPTCPACGRAIS